MLIAIAIHTVATTILSIMPIIMLITRIMFYDIMPVSVNKQHPIVRAFALAVQHRKLLPSP